MADQQSDGQTVTVASAANPEDFAIVIHEGSASGPKIGEATVSGGTHTDITVDLDQSLSSGEHTLVPMLHEAADGGHGPPIFQDGGMVIDQATVTVEGDCQSLEAAIAGEDGSVDDADLLEAIEHWRTGEEVPGTCGKAVGDADLLDLIARWRDD